MISNVTMVLRFPNPNQTYMGDPLGVAGTQDSRQPDVPADAVRALNNNCTIVTNFREGGGRHSHL